MSDDAFTRRTLLEPERDVTNRGGRKVPLNHAETVAAHTLLDRLATSLDWGSGFLTDEDIGAWNLLSDAVGHKMIAVNLPARGVRGEIALPVSYSYQLIEVGLCDSYLDTAVEGEPVRFSCGLRRGHRGDHLTYDSGELGPRFWNDKEPV